MTSAVTATIYHNPCCSKSRAALALLQEEGVEVRVIEYMKTPPAVGELRRLYARAGMSPRDGLRWTEPGADHLRDADDPIILEAMLVNPALIERPLVENRQGRRPSPPAGARPRHIVRIRCPTAGDHVHIAVHVSRDPLLSPATGHGAFDGTPARCRPV